MKFSPEDWKRIFDKDRIGNWIVAYKRQVAVGCVLVCLAAAAAFTWGGKEEKTAQAADGAAEGPKAEAAVAAEAPVEEDKLEKDAYPEVNQLMEQYFTYLSSGDMDELMTVVDTFTDEEMNNVLSNRSLVEGYSNISCYTKKGMEEGAYVVFACYDQKFMQVDTVAPGVKGYYVYPDAEGNLRIFFGEASEDLVAFVEQASADPDVLALKAEVEAKFAEALASDEALANLVTKMDKAKAEEALAVAEGNAEEEAGEPSEEEGSEEAPAEEPEEEPAEEETQEPEEEAPAEEETSSEGEAEATQVNEETRFTESIRRRAGRGTDTEYLGTAYQGESVTRIEDYSDGWSKINYNGKECYCMTEFLE